MRLRLAPIFMAEFERAKADRRAIEERWLMDLRQFKGRCDPETLWPHRESIQGVREAHANQGPHRQCPHDGSAVPSGGDRNYLITHTPNPDAAAGQAQGVVERDDDGARTESPKQPDKKMVHEAVVDVAQKSAEAMMATIDDQFAEARYKRECKRVIASGNLYGLAYSRGRLSSAKSARTTPSTSRPESGRSAASSTTRRLWNTRRCGASTLT